MPSLAPREVIATLVVERTAEALHRIFPKARKLYLVGSRLRHRYGRDLDFVVLGTPPFPREVRVGSLKVNLFWTPNESLEPTVLEHALGMDIVRWKRKARSMGFFLNRYGLWRGQVRVAHRVVDIARMLHMPVKPFLLETLKNPL